jgi:hypothetical protein
MPEPVSTTLLISNLINAMDNLLTKFPSYPEKQKKDYAELKAAFDAYKTIPIEERVNRYLHNLARELSGHVVAISRLDK